jgi:rhodanese-related sulfurtransferase/DNA-binding transcriptional ArsR family regulator
MDKRTFKDKAYTELARITNALSNPRRLEIIDLLAQGEKSVDMIAQETSLSIANASQHLQVLKASLLVETKREGNFIFYRIASDKVLLLWDVLKTLGFERMAEIERLVEDFRKQKNVLESISIPELLERMESGKAFIIDVRPEGEFNNGHIPEAVSVPIEQLKDRLKALPKSKEIIAYCRGPFCVYADEAVELLKQHKFRAIRLNEGFPEWKNQGLAIQTNS